MVQVAEQILRVVAQAVGLAIAAREKQWNGIRTQAGGASGRE